MQKQPDDGPVDEPDIKAWKEWEQFIQNWFFTIIFAY